MTTIKRSAATLAVLAAGLVAAAPANAQSQGFVIDGPYTVQQSDGIIAILIGRFTPPIGSNKGSFAGTGWGLDEAERQR